MNLIYEYAPSGSLVFFFVFFLWVAYCAYRPCAKKKMESHASIPLRKESQDE